MAFNENMSKLAIVFVILFLCRGLQSSVTQNSTFEYRVLYYRSKTNATEASFSKAQHHASIRLKEHDGNICSGVVIGLSVVLTTAHCVYNYNTNKPYHPSELSVLLASINHYQPQEQTLVFGVTHSYQPDTFNALNLNDNVAILMLDRDIPKMNDVPKAIALPQGKLVNTTNKFEVTTWLKLNEGLSPNQLMLVNASQVNDEICLQYYGEAVFSSGMLCIVSSEPLDKDFGSPLFIENKLVGLRSFSSGHLSPAIYTDVSYHANWIRGLVGDGSNRNSSVWGTFGFLLFTYVALKRTKLMKAYGS